MTNRKASPRDRGERVRLEAYMRPSLLRAVEDLADREDTSVSELTREALRDLLVKRGVALPEK